MELFVLVLAIYLGIDAVVVFIKAGLDPMGVSAAETLDIMISVGLMVWAIVLLVR